MMISLLILVWAVDLFLLPSRTGFSLPVRFSGLHKVLFILCAALFPLVLTTDAVPVDAFFVFLFLALGFYCFFRSRIEKTLYTQIYYGNRDEVRRFLWVCVSGMLLRWFLGVLVLSTAIHVFQKAFFPVLNSELNDASLLSVCAGLWMVFLIASFSHRVKLYSFRDLLGLPSQKGSWGRDVILPVVLGVATAGVASYVLAYRSAQPVTPFSEMLDWSETSWTVMVFILAALVIAPFLEEVIFRGFFFRIIQELKNRTWAFWTVGISFGLMHMQQYWGDALGITIIFFIGFLLTTLRFLFHTTRPGIVLHYTFNILMVILPSVFFAVSHPVFSQYQLKYQQLSVRQQEHLLKESIQEDPRNVSAYDELAWLYVQNGGDLNQALTLIDKALSISKRSIFQYTRAEILYALGRRQAAIAELEDILKRMPDNREVRKRLRQMKRGLKSS